MYNHKEIESRWQKFWEENKTFKTENPSIIFLKKGEKQKTKSKYYCLDMFPYPSGAGLHVGHPEGYTANDIVARYKHACGYNVLHPMGWDAFGLPAENYAIKTGTHPKITTNKNIETFKKQIKSLGFSYDWEREIDTTDPKYYKWTQWIFLKLFEAGLAYEQDLPINYCPSCKTGLANEEVLNDFTCDRCGTKVEKRQLRQWVLAITKYAERLLHDVDKLDWPEGIKDMQRNWIGKSEGCEFEMKKAIDNEVKLIEIKNLEEFRKNISPDCELSIQGKIYKIKEIVNFKLEDGNFYTKLILNDDYVLAEDRENNCFLFVREFHNNLELQEKDFVFDNKKFSFLYKTSAIAEEVYGKIIWKKGYMEVFYDYIAEDKSYISLGLDKIINKRLDFIGNIIDIDEVKIKKNSIKKQKVLILHGFASNSNGSWIPWLKKELENNNCKVLTPDLIDSENPDLEKHLKQLEKYKNEIDENTIIIGHSLGCITALSFISEYNLKIKKFIAIAPMFNSIDLDKLASSSQRISLVIDLFKSYVNGKILNVEKINTDIGEICLYISKTDPFIPFDNAKKYYQENFKNLKITEFEDKGHLNRRPEVYELPEILDDILFKNISISVYTTRIDTVFGMTYAVLAPDHPQVLDFITPEQKEICLQYIEKSKKKSDQDRTADNKEKTGVFTGSYVINPYNNEKVPLWIADYVLGNYGTGAVMAVPAHDERDFEFVNEVISINYNFMEEKDFSFNRGDFVKNVIEPTEEDKNIGYGYSPTIGILASDDIEKDKKIMAQWKYEQYKNNETFYKNYGVLVNSGNFTGLTSEEARQKLTKFAEKNGFGTKKVNYKLRDWLFSRQRYWGEPIPLIHIDIEDYEKLPRIRSENPPIPNPFPPREKGNGEEKYSSFLEKTPNYITKLSQELRKNSTKTEEIMWELLRNKQLNGIKFRRQHPFGRYIADFYSDEQKLVIEIDGGIHESAKQKEYDEIRDEIIQKYSVKILRIKNEEIKNDLENVIQKIISCLSTPFSLGGKGWDRGTSGENTRIEEKFAYIVEKESGEYLYIGQKEFSRIYDGLYTKIICDYTLPLELPEVKDYEPSGDGNSPLAKIESFVNVKLADNLIGKRETNTMPQWGGSCWYYLRYMDPHNENELVNPEIEKYWGQVDSYVGGAEHAVLHLLYARFWHKFLFDIGVVSSDEPFYRLRNQGLILAHAFQRKNGGLVANDLVEEKNGKYYLIETGEELNRIVSKMSKSLKNVINPDEIVSEYGADALRLYEMYMADFKDAAPWDSKGIVGVSRFLDKVWRLFMEEKRFAESDEEAMKTLHKTIKKVGEDIENYKFNTAIAQLMICVNTGLPKDELLQKEWKEKFLIILHPFAPHIAEELWKNFTKNKIKQAYLATGNKNKMTRLQMVIEKNNLPLSIDQYQYYQEVEETGNTALENALQKMEPYKAKKIQFPIITTDSGMYFDGIVENPTYIKRNALKFAGLDEKSCSQEQIAEAMSNYYKKLARENGGTLDFHYEDAWVILLPNDTILTHSYKREYTLTDKENGPRDIYFPMRNLYISKITEKYAYEQTEEDTKKEFDCIREMLEKLFSDSIFFASWPEYDEKITIDDTIKIGVQVNGKLRGDIEITKDESQSSALQKARENVDIQKWIEGHEIIKEIYVPGRIVSIIVK